MYVDTKAKGVTFWDTVYTGLTVKLCRPFKLHMRCVTYTLEIVVKIIRRWQLQPIDHI